MKRLDLVQLTIINVGIFSGYLFISSLPQLLYVLYQFISDGMTGTYMSTFFGFAFVYFFYVLVSIFCITRSKQLALWISNKANLEGNIDFALDKSAMLFVLFIGLGLYGLINHVPSFLVAIFNIIKDRQSHLEMDTLGASDKANLAVKALTILAFFTLVYYAKTFSDFFASKIKNTEPEAEETLIN